MFCFLFLCHFNLLFGSWHDFELGKKEKVAEINQSIGRASSISWTSVSSSLLFCFEFWFWIYFVSFFREDENFRTSLSGLLINYLSFWHSVLVYYNRAMKNFWRMDLTLFLLLIRLDLPCMFLPVVSYQVDEIELQSMLIHVKVLSSISGTVYEGLAFP